MSDLLRKALEAIAAVPVNGNSDPDVMATALNYIDEIANAALAGKKLPAEPDWGDEEDE